MYKRAFSATSRVCEQKTLAVPRAGAQKETKLLLDVDKDDDVEVTGAASHRLQRANSHPRELQEEERKKQVLAVVVSEMPEAGAALAGPVPTSPRTKPAAKAVSQVMAALKCSRSTAGPTMTDIVKFISGALHKPATKRQVISLFEFRVSG